MDEEYKIAVSVVMWHLDEKKYVEDTLKSLQAQSYRNFNVFFTLNGLDGDMAEYVKRIIPDVNVITHTQNIGYAPAHQKVFELAFDEGGFDAVVVINLDVIADPRWLENLVKTAYSDDSVGLVQPTIYMWRDGKTDIVNTDGGESHYLGFSYCGNYGKKGPVFTEDRQIPFASGCSLLVKKQVYQATGGFDTDLFIYLDDVDLSWRAFLLGYSSCLSADSRFWHRYDFRGEFTSKTKMYLLERNRFTVLLKNYSLKTLILVAPALLFMESGVLFYSTIRGFLPAKIKSYFGVLRQLPRTLSKRKIVQRNRKASDREILKLFTGELEFPLIAHPLLDLANPLFKAYFRIIKAFI